MKTVDLFPGWAERLIQTAGAEIFLRTAVVRFLGHQRFTLGGHDRGGRVAYRLALDHPEAVTPLLPLDILPTTEVWQRLRPESAGCGHFLAEENPQSMLAAVLPFLPHGAGP